MINKIYTCLWFDKEAKAAAEFYCSVFSEATITADTPMVTTFEISGRKFMGLNGGPQYKVNPSVSFFAICDTLEETDALWAKLSEGGMVMMPLNKYPWSEKYGWCQDKFGVNWQLMIKTVEGTDKIIPAMMFTQEQAGKCEEAMKFYTSLFTGSGIIMISRYEKGEPDVEGYIKHAQFRLNDQLFIAFESSMSHAFSFSEGVSFVVECDTQAEIDQLWYHLTKGGEESMCGWLKDKFGFSWQIIPSILSKLMSDPATAQKTVAAFMQMKKFDIATLEKAAYA